MRARFRIWFAIVVIMAIVFVVQMFFQAEFDALVVEYASHQYVVEASRLSAETIDAVDSGVNAYWPDASEFINSVPGFWWGALTVLIIWGLLEMIYGATRKFRYGAGEPKPVSQAEIQEARTLLNKRKEFQTADARRILASALDDLYAEGTKRRDLLIPPLEHFNHKVDYDKEDAKLEAWNQRALTVLDHPLIAVADRSRFRTLDSFEPETHPMAGKSPRQEKLEAVWNEKLRQLRAIIDEVGETSVARLQPLGQQPPVRQLASSGSGGSG